jgi:HrpA-like helicases
MRVLRPAPRGVRKIILSTNIAETVYTRGDVMFIIDSGKVREVSVLQCEFKLAQLDLLLLHPRHKVGEN